MSACSPYLAGNADACAREFGADGKVLRGRIRCERNCDIIKATSLCFNANKRKEPLMSAQAMRNNGRKGLVTKCENAT